MDKKSAIRTAFDRPLSQCEQTGQACGFLDYTKDGTFCIFGEGQFLIQKPALSACPKGYLNIKR